MRTHDTQELTIRGGRNPITFLCNDYHQADEIRKERTWYEHWLLEVIRRNFHSLGGIWLDIGASCGNHSMYFAEHCNPDGVLAFEPNEDTFKLLVQNCKPWASIRPLNMAIGGKEGHVHSVTPDAESLSMGAARIEAGGDTIMMTVDGLGIAPSVTLMKIDVEGGEREVIMGALDTIEASRPEIFVETWEPDTLDWLVNNLGMYGYELKERYCHAPVYHFSTRVEIPRTYKA